MQGLMICDFSLSIDALWAMMRRQACLRYYSPRSAMLGQMRQLAAPDYISSGDRRDNCQQRSHLLPSFISPIRSRRRRMLTFIFRIILANIKALIIMFSMLRGRDATAAAFSPRDIATPRPSEL